MPARDELLLPLPYTECRPGPDAPAAVGDPCMVHFGDDTCDLTAYCDEVDPGTITGVCRALCVGDVTMPTCADPGTTCALFVEGQPEFGGVCRPA